MPSLRIQIVDDSQVTLDVLRTVIAFKQWTVCAQAEDGPSAVAQFKESLPDVVLLDLVLGNMDGIEVARQMSRYNPVVPIILFTAFDFEGLAEAAGKAGVCAVVRKGECSTMIASIENAFDQYERLIQ